MNSSKLHHLPLVCVVESRCGEHMYIRVTSGSSGTWFLHYATDLIERVLFIQGRPRLKSLTVRLSSHKLATESWPIHGSFVWEAVRSPCDSLAMSWIVSLAFLVDETKPNMKVSHLKAVRLSWEFKITVNLLIIESNPTSYYTIDFISLLQCYVGNVSFP